MLQHLLEILNKSDDDDIVISSEDPFSESFKEPERESTESLLISTLFKLFFGKKKIKNVHFHIIGLIIGMVAVAVIVHYHYSLKKRNINQTNKP